MSIQGPGSTPVRLPYVPATAPNPARAARPAATPEAAPAAEPASLWDLLTPDERTFFQQLSTLGRLSYGPGQKPEDSAAAPTGRRIDVRG